MIFEWGFVKALIDSFGLGGGSEEQDNEIIQFSLKNISYFIFDKITNFDYPLFTYLKRDIDEEFELEGGNDEIECHLYSSEDIYIRS